MIAGGPRSIAPVPPGIDSHHLKLEPALRIAPILATDSKVHAPVTEHQLGFADLLAALQSFLAGRLRGWFFLLCHAFSPQPKTDALIRSTFFLSRMTRSYDGWGPRSPALVPPGTDTHH